MTSAELVLWFVGMAAPWSAGASVVVWGVLTLIGVVGGWMSQRVGGADAALLMGLRVGALLGLAAWGGTWLAAWLVRYGLAALAWLPVVGGGVSGPDVGP